MTNKLSIKYEEDYEYKQVNFDESTLELSEPIDFQQQNLGAEIERAIKKVEKE